MSWIKIKSELNKKVIVCEYADRQAAKNDIVKNGEQILEVHNLQDYKQHIEDWNISQERKQSGQVFEKQEKIVLTSNISYNRISEKGKQLLSVALKTNNESDWMVCLIQHNEEKWSNKEYCCSGQIPYFKTCIQKLMINGSLGF